LDGEDLTALSEIEKTLAEDKSNVLAETRQQLADTIKESLAK
jgi:hypothetical protein